MELPASIKKIYKNWFKNRKWKSFDFQEKLLEHYVNGYSGILCAPTGTGKTYAAWLPILIKSIHHYPHKKGLKAIWVTPMRALAADIRRAMQSAADDLHTGWRIESRTGDTSATARKRQKVSPPDALVITPESLHVLLSQKEYARFFQNLEAIVIDEWHELIGTKRGVQVELALSRIKTFAPDLKIWGISATIGNMDEALEVLMGNDKTQARIIINSEIEKDIVVESLIPKEIEKYPWAGHLGIQLLPKILEIIKKGGTTLIFTNVRSQCEIWYQQLLAAEPELAGQIALHHGSLSQEIREWVENALHNEILKVVVCTSSLDLGVDFRPVETVIQIGSPKGVARFIQRAGRSGHHPGAKSKIYFVPAHSLELIEAAALREAVNEGKVESRIPVVRAFDVLIQYLITLAVSDGFRPEEIFSEIKSTHAFESVTKEEWMEVLNFISTGGPSLKSYEEYKKVVVEDGLWIIKDRYIAQRHRLSIGTIVSDPMITVKYQSGGYIGSIEEYFITRLKPGEIFAFGGKTLELITIRDNQAIVRNSKSKKAVVPQWMGGRLYLSSRLSDLIRKKLNEAVHGSVSDVEVKVLKPLFERQRRDSVLPDEHQFLIESILTKEGTHLFFYTFEGRYVNEGIAALIAYRISRQKAASFSIAMTDYGFELLTDDKIIIEEVLEENIFTTLDLHQDIQVAVNSTEMARRKFRNIAAIAGLTFQGYPGKQMKSKHLQASTRLFFEVFREHEPNHLLLRQAYEEVFYDQLDEDRIRLALERINNQEIIVRHPDKLTPFAFPILAEQFRESSSNEKLEDKLRKIIKNLEK